ncbi:PREDICTED: uncharacterized protein LOC104753936 [Camelina sativa]|uniref:Uncharacterized protein LOC104753936 n=1 Tax=Camelina sativa TaxID=90675 RepID=A0ABM0WPX1_CAMSA|nr:PREDICTED: uncharacterized protein LOC104753936 [Camelina sativa]
MQQLENPDHHVTTMQYSDLYCRVKDMLDSVDCPLQMNYKDLIRPEPSRTEFFISSLMNFALHRDSKMNKIKEKAEELTLLDEERKQSEATIAQLNAEIGEFDEAAEWDSPFVQELEARIEECCYFILNVVTFDRIQENFKVIFATAVTNAKAVDKEFKALKSKLSEDGVAYKSHEAKVAERERIVERLNKSLKQLEKEKAVMFDDWTNQLNNLKVEVESRRRELEARQTDVESVVAVVDDNNAKIKQVRESGEAKVKRLAAKYEEIVKQFREYKVSFDAVLPSLPKGQGSSD